MEKYHPKPKQKVFIPFFQHHCLTFSQVLHMKVLWDERVHAHRLPEHTLYLPSHATNCNRLDHEAVKWRSPCVWPRLISSNVVFYVMPCSPRTLCSLQQLINTLNQDTLIMTPMGMCVLLCKSVQVAEFNTAVCSLQWVCSSEYFVK